MIGKCHFSLRLLSGWLLASNHSEVSICQLTSWDTRLTRRNDSLVHRPSEMKRLVVTRFWNCAVELTNQREAFCWIWEQCEVTASEINHSHFALSSCGPQIGVVIKRSVKISGVNLSGFDCFSISILVRGELNQWGEEVNTLEAFWKLHFPIGRFKSAYFFLNSYSLNESTLKWSLESFSLLKNFTKIFHILPYQRNFTKFCIKY